MSIQEHLKKINPVVKFGRGLRPSDEGIAKFYYGVNPYTYGAVFSLVLNNSRAEE